MELLYERYAAQQVLAPLAEGRRLVPGHGPPGSPVLVIGEAPGEQEERTGRPFTGPSGQLLQEIFKSAGISWPLCYVTNVIPWRPPGNRTPYPFQVHASWQRVAGEIELVDPEVIIAAGDTAWRGVTQLDMGRFAAARWKWHELNGRRLLAVPHPAWILRLDDAERSGAVTATVRALRLALPGSRAA
jgi:DNA polymerase